ncbi:uncharacterized protein [Typha angustifolia]|uniref:uncharacterized protein n=1 Tax=Typha angustifolia TaxID=59011 RepID=UPI003C2D2479
MAQSLIPLNPSRFHLSLPLTSRSRLSGPYSLTKLSTQTHASPVLLLVVRAAQSSGQNSSSEPTQDNTKVTNSNYSSTGVNFPNISLASIPPWARWVLGSIILLALPFYRRFLTIEDQVEKTAEVVLETVEKVAEVTEKVSAEVAELLPENAELKQFALKVEKMSEEVAKDAEIAESLIKKVDEVVDGIDAMVEPVIETKIPIGESKPEEDANTST